MADEQNPIPHEEDWPSEDAPVVEETFPKDVDTGDAANEVQEDTSKGSGILKWVVLGLGGLIFLVGLAAVFFLLVLPNLGGGDFVRLGPGTPSVFHPDGMTVSLAVPGEEQVSLTTIPREVFLENGAGDEWSAARGALPAEFTALSPIYIIERRGDIPLLAEMAIPNGAEPLEQLDLYRWDADSGQWVFQPSQVDTARQLVTFTPAASTAPVMAVRTAQRTPAGGIVIAPGGPDLGPDYGLALLDGISIDASGQITGSPAESTAGTRYLMLTNRTGGFGAYDDAAASQPIIDYILSGAGGYDGILLNFATGPGYEVFLASLQTALGGKPLDIVVTTSEAANAELSAYSPNVSRMWLTANGDPHAYLDDSTIEAGLTALTDAMPRGQVGLLVNAQHVQARGDSVADVTFEEAVSHFGTPEAIAGYLDTEGVLSTGAALPVRLSGSVESMGYDEALQANYLTYRDDGGIVYHVYFSSPASLAYRLRWASTYNLGVVAARGIAHPDAPQSINDGLAGYFQDAQLAAPAPLEIRWRVTSSAGADLAGQSGDLGLLQFLWADASEPGEYTINAVVSDGSTASERGGVPVSVADPTDEPTPSATATVAPPARPTTDPNATPAPAQPTPVPAPAQVTGGITAGVFELGGQTHSLGYPAQMQQAGMTWVKFQHKWSPGDDPAATMAARINNAHAQGFKVLLAIPGVLYPDSIDFNAYVNYVAGVAALGPDAIEIWNEQNLAREWPLNDISGASYVNNMLAPAYAAIKAANPNVLVIGGAPAPSGAWGPTGCGDTFGGGCSDLGYLQQMANAGAANHMDCMGAHYNEGIISPTQPTGDPRDEYYTRYFSGMLNTYYSVFGIPVCFTELGFLTSEGYGALPPNFSWAGSTTIAQQAQWLSEAAVLSSQSGKVRLMIIWNVDIFDYGSDPQGGYAIVRPGGQCPACEALGAAWGGG